MFTASRGVMKAAIAVGVSEESKKTFVSAY